MDSNQTTTTGVAAGPPPQKPQNQSSNQGRGSGSRGQGRDRGQGRGHGSRGQGRGNQQQGRGEGPVGIAPTTGIPYGHVPAYLPGSSSLVEEDNGSEIATPPVSPMEIGPESDFSDVVDFKDEDINKFICEDAAPDA